MLALTIFAVSLPQESNTRVAKLVDALVSGSSGVTTLSVRVRSRVQTKLAAMSSAFLFARICVNITYNSRLIVKNN